MDTRNEDTLRRLEIQVAKLEAIVPSLESQKGTVMSHGEDLATLKQWTREHERQEGKTAARFATLAGILGALCIKVFEWVHDQLLALGGHVGH